jgi:hypothetical protein
VLQVITGQMHNKALTADQYHLLTEYSETRQNYATQNSTSIAAKLFSM